MLKNGSVIFQHRILPSLVRHYCSPPKHVLQLHHSEIPTLKEKLQSEEVHDELYDRVNIGFLYDPSLSKKAATKRSDVMRKNRRDAILEEQARLRTLKINLSEVEKEWIKTIGPDHMFKIADHYNIFKDLFDLAYFYPVKDMNITYSKTLNNEQIGIPVYRGNILQASEASHSPIVEYRSEPNQYWSLVMTSLDSHFTQENGEYLHWFVANIPGNDIGGGQTVCDYMGPFPAHGSGYHRVAFVLYHHDKKIDFSAHLRSSPCTSLADRTFSTLEFYRTHQGDITPAALNFFQAVWDPSVHDFYHDILRMKEPYFKFNAPEPHRASEKTYPIHKRFDTYLESHRDPRDVAKEVILLKLRGRRSPFVAPDPRPAYPNCERYEGAQTTWQREDTTKRRLGWGKYRYLYDDEADNF